MRRGLVFFGVLLASACRPVAPTSMEQVQFPEDFKLDTARQVKLQVVGAADEAGSLTVRVPGGGVVFEGPASYLVAHGLTVRAQPEVTSLEIVRNGTPEVVALADDGSATYTLPAR